MNCSAAFLCGASVGIARLSTHRSAPASGNVNASRSLRSRASWKSDEYAWATIVSPAASFFQ